MVVRIRFHCLLINVRMLESNQSHLTTCLWTGLDDIDD